MRYHLDLGPLRMTTIPPDILIGTRAIAAFLGTYQMSALRLLRAGAIRGRLVDGKWVAQKSQLAPHRTASVRAYEARP